MFVLLIGLQNLWQSFFFWGGGGLTVFHAHLHWGQKYKTVNIFVPIDFGTRSSKKFFEVLGWASLTFFSIHFENKRKTFIFLNLFPHMSKYPPNVKKCFFFMQVYWFHENNHFFTFGGYLLIWGKNFKKWMFSFVLKVNRKKVRDAHPRTSKYFFED